MSSSPSIFKKVIPKGAVPVVTFGKNSRIYVEMFGRKHEHKHKHKHTHGKANTKRKVISSSLFIFPDRVKTIGGDYKNRVREYMDGLETTARGMSGYDGWEFVIYVDYSVYDEYDDKEVAEITSSTQSKLEAMTRQYPALNLCGVRMTSATIGSATFMPSVWRFLPMVDHTVDIFTSTDLDNPPSPLSMHFGERWLADKNEPSNRLFITMDNYHPAQCVIYMARHLDMDETNSVKNMVKCPIAQFWFWKRHESGPMWFEAMMDAIEDEDIGTFFAMDTSWIYDDLRKAAIKTPRFAAILKDPQANVSVRELSQVIKDALVTPPPVTSKQLQGMSVKDWIKRVNKSAALSNMLTLMVFGRIISSLADNTMYQVTANTLTKPESMTLIKKLTMSAGYGVDEYVMNILMNPPARGSSNALMPAKVISTITPGTGLKPGSSSKGSTQAFSMMAGSPIRVKMLTASAVNECPTLPYSSNQLGYLRGAEYIVKSAIMLTFLRPSGNSSEASRRWHQDLTRDYKERARYLSTQDDPIGSIVEHEFPFVRAMTFKLIEVDKAKFSEWCSSIGIQYAGDRFVYSPAADLHLLKDVILARVMLDWNILMLSACIDPSDIEKFNAIPW